MAEYEQARADMFAQQEQLAQLRTEYAQLQDLERLQKEQDEQMQAAAQARSASSADPPSSDADATDEEREKEALLARLAALQEEHRRMEQEREDLLNQSREHQLREKAALFRQAQLLQQASRQAEDIERRERQQAESSNAADVDDIGGGVDALEEEDGEFDEEEARATLAYLENQHTVLQEQRHQVSVWRVTLHFVVLSREIRSCHSRPVGECVEPYSFASCSCMFGFFVCFLFFSNSAGSRDFHPRRPAECGSL